MITAPLSSLPMPEKAGGPTDEKLRALWERVQNALLTLPWDFESDINIVGIRATDLFTFNTALGAAIEQSVVDNLNKLRPVWDPGDEYRLYRFVRHPHMFPDVRLQSDDATVDDVVLMGIELKGWFALAKEGEPSFRYKVSPQVCAPQDLLVVYPWILQEVISGSPMLLQPFIVEARYAAEIRNYYWSVEKGRGKTAASVKPSAHKTPYPPRGAIINDVPSGDGGGNFGRVSRGGQVMDEYISVLMKSNISGIPLGAWQAFIKIFAADSTSESIKRRIESLKAAYPSIENPDKSAAFERLISEFAVLMGVDLSIDLDKPVSQSKRRRKKPLDEAAS